MRRRDFIKVIAGSATAWPLIVRAQQPSIPVIGFLGIRSSDEATHLLAAFNDGLREFGFVDDQNVSIQYRWAENDYGRLPALAADLARRQVSVIAATGGGASARAAITATTNIPIVFVAGDLDPVKSGLVKSLNRPGGNITGITPISSVLTSKRLELLHQTLPNATAIGVLANPDFPSTEEETSDAQAAARKLGLNLHVVEANAEDKFEAAFTAFTQHQVAALLLLNDALFLSRREHVIALAARHHLPTIYYFREFVIDGGLMSYAPSLADAYRLAGVYIGKILKGEKPADLPVMLPTKFELVSSTRRLPRRSASPSRRAFSPSPTR